MPTADGKLLTLDLFLTLLGVKVKVEGTVEILDIRKKLD
jgi:hypothetical protein